MKDFVDKVKQHVRNKYDITLYYGKSGRWPGYWLFYCGRHSSYPESYVCDNEDFEQQVYNAVNWILKEIQKDDNKGTSEG